MNDIYEFSPYTYSCLIVESLYAYSCLIFVYEMVTPQAQS